VDFFQKLKTVLLNYNIELNLVYGKSKLRNAANEDVVDIDWAQSVKNRILKLGKNEIIWQSCLNHIKDKDLVIIQPEIKLIITFYLIIARHFSKFKLGFWGHGRNMQADINTLPNRFQRLFLKKCDRWFAYTIGVKNYLLNNNYPENKITVTQNAIDTLSLRKYYSEITDAELNQLKNQLGIQGSKTGIYCGRMYPDKRLDFIIETCIRVKKHIPDFHMIFVGAGIDAYQAQETSKTYDWIHYVGPKFGKEQVKYFKLSSVQLMPGLVGLGILDSFATETPIITTNFPYHSPEIDYLENGINGIMTNNNIDDYSNSVVQVLKNDEYLKLRDGCKLAAEKYTVERMVDNFKNGILLCLNS
jgi:L-malate glycosyltransferase